MHPKHEQLSAYALATIPENVAEPIAAHVKQCADCEATIAEYETVADAMIEKLRVGEPIDEFAEEARCREMLVAIKQLGAELSSSGIANTIDSAVPPLIRDYELFEKLGQGGMGAVYRAKHRKLQRFVALKVLTSNRTRNNEAIARFEREMQAVGQLSHPNIVGATDAGEAEGTHYLVMELVEGVNLSELVRAVGPLSVADACEIIRQSSVGLEHAHRRALVHRDIKPSNMMLARLEDSDSEPATMVKILDMGLALLDAERVPSSGDLTSEGQMMGTLDYMAPEQFGDSRQVDARADIYSLGATLYKLLCGQAPFASERFDNTLDMLAALASQPAPPLQRQRADVPQQLADLVGKMLAKSGSDRPNNAADVARMLESFCSRHDLPKLLDQARLAIGERTSSEQSVVGTHDAFADPTSPSVLRKPKSESMLPSRYSKLLLGGVSSILIALAAIIVIDFTNGTVLVESADGDQLPPGVSIVLQRNGEKVSLRSDVQWRTTVSPGEYRIQVLGGGNEFHFDGDTLSVSRFGETVLEIRKRANANESPAHNVGDKTQDRRIAEWATTRGGEVTLRVGNPPWKYATRIEELPEMAFDVLGIEFSKSGQITEDELVIISGAQHIGQLVLANQSIADPSVKCFKSLPSLERLYLNETQFTDEGLRQLVQISTLETLYISSPNITDVGLAVLPNMSNLVALKIAGNKLTPASWSHFGNIVQLEYLELYAHGTDDKDLMQLAQLSNLETLRLRFGDLSGAGLESLSARIPQCRVLYAAGSEWIVVGNTDRYAAVYAIDHGGSIEIEVGGTLRTINESAALPQEPLQLVGVDLTGRPYRIAGFLGVELLGVKNLRSIVLDATELNGEAISYLRFYPTLKTISVRGGRFPDAGLRHLHQLNQLTSLDLTDCKNITDEGIRALREALPECDVKH